MAEGLRQPETIEERQAKLVDRVAHLQATAVEAIGLGAEGRLSARVKSVEMRSTRELSTRTVHRSSVLTQTTRDTVDKYLKITDQDTGEQLTKIQIGWPLSSNSRSVLIDSNGSVFDAERFAGYRQVYFGRMESSDRLAELRKMAELDGPELEACIDHLADFEHGDITVDATLSSTIVAQPREDTRAV